MTYETQGTKRTEAYFCEQGVELAAQARARAAAQAAGSLAVEGLVMGSVVVPEAPVEG